MELVLGRLRISIWLEEKEGKPIPEKEMQKALDELKVPKDVKNSILEELYRKG